MKKCQKKINCFPRRGGTPSRMIPQKNQFNFLTVPLHHCIFENLHTFSHPSCILAYFYTFTVAYLQGCIPSNLHGFFIYSHTYVLAYFLTCIFTDLYIHESAYLYTYILAYLNNCIFAYLHIYMIAYLHTYLHVYLHIY